MIDNKLVLNNNWFTETMSTYDNPYLDPDAINELEQDVPFYIRDQEIYGKFLDRGDECLFHLEWFHTTQNKLEEFTIKRLVVSLDTAFKTGEDNDCSAAVVIAETFAGIYYILDMFNKKLEFPELLVKTKEFVEGWSNLSYILIEDKASGQSLIQVLKRELSNNIRPIQVSNDKFTRAAACSTLFEKGRVMLLEAPWNKELTDQMCEFSGNLDSPDDIVDAVTQGLNFLTGSNIDFNPEKVIRRKVIPSSSIMRGY
jgi:predicted phage terminase large subunit-like protein